MLEKDPRKRVSSVSAMCHPVFSSEMSRSPLITRKLFNSEQLIRVSHMTAK